jgi:hypothetical protein
VEVCLSVPNSGKYSKFAFALIVCLLGSNSFANDVEWSGSVDFHSYLIGRELNQTIEPISSTFDSVNLLGGNFSMTKDLLRIEVRPEVRALFGDSNQLATNSPAYIQLQSPNRWFDTRWHINEPPNTTVYGDFEKLSMSLIGDNSEVYVGRRVLGLGVMKAFPIWNKFSKPLPGVTTVPIIFGSDGFGGRVQFGQWAFRAADVISDYGETQSYFGEATWYQDEIELHFMAGSWWHTSVSGISAVKDLFEGTLTFESLFYDGNFQGGLGYDRALDEKWTLLVEGLFQSNGAESALDYNPYLSSRFQTLQAKFYSYVQLGFQASSKWKFQLTGLTNWIDRGTDLNGEATVSLSDHFDLSFGANVPCGPSNAEFSTQSFQFSDGTYFGLPLQFLARVDLTF